MKQIFCDNLANSFDSLNNSLTDSNLNELDKYDIFANHVKSQIPKRIPKRIPSSNSNQNYKNKRKKTNLLHQLLGETNPAIMLYRQEKKHSLHTEETNLMRTSSTIKNKRLYPEKH